MKGELCTTVPLFVQLIHTGGNHGAVLADQFGSFFTETGIRTSPVQMPNILLPLEWRLEYAYFDRH
jgi:hypothetical protein